MSIINLFLLLLSVAAFVSGFTGYAIFGPLTMCHLQDRQAQLPGTSSFSPYFLWWIMRGQFTQNKDSNLNGLARPAQILLWFTLLGGIGTLLLFPPFW